MISEPPYDGKPCPGCDPCIGHENSYFFNALNRWGQGSMIEKLWDAKDYTIPDPVIDHPALHRYVKIGREVQETIRACVVLNGSRFEWMPGTMERLMFQGKELKAAMVELQYIKEAHQHDNRHCRGTENVLRARNFGEHTLWGAREPYVQNDHWVRKQSHPWTIHHPKCGTHYEVHEYFKEQIAADPAFYGRFYCEKCRSEIPWNLINTNL